MNDGERVAGIGHLCKDVKSNEIAGYRHIGNRDILGEDMIEGVGMNIASNAKESYCCSPKPGRER